MILFALIVYILCFVWYYFRKKSPLNREFKRMQYLELKRNHDFGPERMARLYNSNRVVDFSNIQDIINDFDCFVVRDFGFGSEIWAVKNPQISNYNSDLVAFQEGFLITNIISNVEFERFCKNNSKTLRMFCVRT